MSDTVTGGFPRGFPCVLGHIVPEVAANGEVFPMTDFTFSTGLQVDLPVVGFQRKSPSYWGAGISRLFSESLQGPAERVWI